MIGDSETTPAPDPVLGFPLIHGFLWHKDVMTDLGITYRGLRQFDRALALFDQAKKLDPKHWQSYYNEVVVLAFDLKKTAEAKAALAQLEQMQPANPDVKKLADAVARVP